MSDPQPDLSARFAEMNEAFVDLERRRIRWNLWFRLPASVIGGVLLGLVMWRTLNRHDNITALMLVAGYLVLALSQLLVPMKLRSLKDNSRV